jgi:hypothetical protein
MSFAAPAGKGKSFFVMAAPSFWQKTGVYSKELGPEKLLTGVFLHEFSHTRQFKGFGSRIDSIERNYQFKDIKMSDDIVQDYFKKDTAYLKIFHAEVDKFYEAAFAEGKRETKRLTLEAIALLESRQARFFTEDKKVLGELDNIFLSMEGVGQFVAVSWLNHPKGGNVPFDIAVKGFRRNRTQWSQEEGLAMFLILNKLTTPDWANDMFGEKPEYIVDLLKEAANNK